MSISSYNPQRSRNVSTIVVYILSVIGIGLLIYFGGTIIAEFTSVGGKSAFSADVFNGEAEVLINDEPLGVTPYETEDVKPGENKITLKGKTNEYNVVLEFLSGSQVVVNRDLGVSDVFSSGQNFWIEEADSGSVFSIITEPTNATVFIDNSQVGSSPYSANDLTPGEYDLRVDVPGYESQTARIKIQEGFKLNVAMKLFPLPVPTRVSLLEGSTNLYDVFSNNPAVTSDSRAWVDSVIYWNQTRGINLAGAGVNKDLVFDYLLSYDGAIYDADGNPITDVENYEGISGNSVGAYLRRVSEGEGLSERASDTVQRLGEVASAQLVEILPTGLGWLRVRDQGSLNGVEVARVDVGNQYVLLEESGDWVRIQVSDDLEGWVSATYVEKVEESSSAAPVTSEEADETDDTQDNQDETVDEETPTEDAIQ